jgi:hypothetical protein
MVDAKAVKEANRKAFLDVFPELANEVLDELRKYNMPEDAYEWTKQVRLHLSNQMSLTFYCMSMTKWQILIPSSLHSELGVQRSRRYNVVFALTGLTILLLFLD